VSARGSPAAELARLARENGRGAVATVIGPEDHPALGRKLLVRADGSVGAGLGDSALDAAATAACEELLWAERSELRDLDGVQVFVDVVAPPPRLFILGAVDYAAALCRLARATGWRPYVCDPRTAFATPERFPEAEEVVAAWPDEAFARLGIDRATYVAILTHDPKLDDAALQIALRSDAAYVGAMGSRRAQARRRERLLEAGMSEKEIGRMVAPIGLDLGAISPEETALSIMAEVVAVRNGHSGGRLRESAGRIHEVGA
jgi:xanthine dehydrogenase accessory factor